MVKTLAKLALTAALGIASSFWFSTRPASVQTPGGDPNGPNKGPVEFDPEVSGTPDATQRAVARDVPGFGGFFINPAKPDRLQVFLIDPERSTDAVKASLSTHLKDYPSFDLGKVDILQGQYGFAQLQAWQDRLTTEVLPLPGVVYIDNQEGKNRVEIGIEIEVARKLVLARAGELGVPAEAIEFEIAAAAENDDLDDPIRPVLGGIAIESQPPGGGDPDGGTCTLGFIARRSGVSGFVTAAHCTETVGLVDGDSFHQPYISGRIGVEAVDPPTFRGGVCPGSYDCRFSDTVWVRLDGSIGSSHGWLAYPEFAGNGATWNGQMYSISSVGTFPVGHAIQKIGQTSGRTAGVITNTNINIWNPETSVYQLYQHRADYGRAGGDSGGPVYYPQPNNNVVLAGIHWGSGGYFSDIQYMQWQQELGPLDIVVQGGGGGGR